MRKTKTKLMLAAIAAAMLSACTMQRQNVDVQSMIEECAELATEEYTLDMLFQNYPTKWEGIKIGPRKILYSGKSRIKAGIDLSDLSSVESIVSTDGREITVVLPEPRILDIIFDECDIQPVFKVIGGLRTDFSNREKQRIRKDAMAELNNRIQNDRALQSIIADARYSTRMAMESMLRKCGGYRKVSVKFKSNTKNG